MLTARRRARIEAATAEHISHLQAIGRLPIRAQVDRMAAAGDRQWTAWVSYAPNIARVGFVSAVAR